MHEPDETPQSRKRRSMPLAEFLAWKARTGGADPAVMGELQATLVDTTDDVTIR